MNEYLDFELRVSPGSGLDYPVSVIRSPAGEASGTMRFPFDALALERQLLGLENAILKSGSLRRDIRTVSPETDNVAGFGKQLFQALFSDEVQTALRRSQDRARAEKKGLRVRMRIEAAELSSLPWEFMYDPHEGDFVCLSSETPIVRYLEFDRPLEELSVEPPISILAVCASPNDRPGLDVEKERGRMEKATQEMQQNGTLTLRWQEQTTYRELQRTLRRGTYHILHFVGHGGFDAAADEGMLALTNDDGGTALTSATDLARLLADHPTLRLVVLNSCLGARGSTTNVFSSTAAALVRRGVPAVVAMQYEISDLAAIEFSRSLYEAIADGLPIDAAVSEARKMVVVTARNSVEWGTPVLHMRSPDGVLFKVDRSKTGTHARPRLTEKSLREVRQEALPAARATIPVPPVPVHLAEATPPARREQLASAPVAPPAASLAAAPPSGATGGAATQPPVPFLRRPLVMGAAAVLVLAVLFKLMSGGGGGSGAVEPEDMTAVAEADSGAPVAEGTMGAAAAADEAEDMTAVAQADSAAPVAEGTMGAGAAADAAEAENDGAAAPGAAATAEPVEHSIARAYLQAISGGDGTKRVPGVIDYDEVGCGPATVWDDRCQAGVYAGKEGKTIFMEAITPIADGADWRESNIQRLLPEADMRRIMNDSAETQAKQLFQNMSDPGNNWFVEQRGPGKAKNILRRYMNAMRR